MSMHFRLRRHATAIGNLLLPVEQATNNLAIDAHRAVAALIQEHELAHRAGAPVDAGTEAVALVAKAASYLTEASTCLAQAHRAYADLSGDMGFGPYCPATPNSAAA